MTIPPEGMDDVGVALGNGAPCGKGGTLVEVTSAISCTQTHTYTQQTQAHTQGKRRGNGIDNNDTAIVSQVTVH